MWTVTFRAAELAALAFLAGFRAAELAVELRAFLASGIAMVDGKFSNAVRSSRVSSPRTPQRLQPMSTRQKKQRSSKRVFYPNLQSCVFVFKRPR